MGTCSCKYCKCFFIVAVACNTGMIGVLLSMYIVFGSMPPSFTMATGFWMLLFNNYYGIFLCLVVTSTFNKQEDVNWVNKMAQIGFGVVGVIFFIGAILFVLPISAEEMMRFCKFYHDVYDDIPPWLHQAQRKFKCCGIYNYTDYNHQLTETNYGKKGFIVYREADPNDDFFSEFKDRNRNRTVGRFTKGFDVPQSCCKSGKAEDPDEEDCGTQIEYTGAEKGTILYEFQREAAEEHVNNPNLGCHEKYRNLENNGPQFQLTLLLVSIQLVSFVQAATFISLIWIHKSAMKSIRQVAFWLPELIGLHEDIEAARAHAHIEAEADEAHEEHEVAFGRAGSNTGVGSKKSKLTKANIEKGGDGGSGKLKKSKSFHTFK